MRVLHVVEVTHGGVVSLARTFAEQQVARGHDVHVLCHADLPASPAFPGVRHTWSPVRRRPATLPAAERRLRAVVREVRPDVVHLHSFFPGLLGRARRLPGTTAVVYQPHSYAFNAVPPRLVGVVAAAERRGARRTDHLVTNCQDERDEGAAHGVEVTASVIGLPLDTTRFAPQDPSRDHAPEPSPYDALGVRASFVAVCVGRISRQKGQRELATAWEHAAPEDSALVLVGPGDPEEIRAAAPSAFGRSVFCAGGQEDVRPWLWGASVSVLPSLYEGQSVAMAEALACGVPVVMTDVNGAREAVAPSGAPAAGAVVAVGDHAELLRQLDLRRGAPALREEESRAARDRAMQLFDSTRVLDRLDAAYDAALGAVRAGRRGEDHA